MYVQIQKVLKYIEIRIRNNIRNARIQDNIRKHETIDEIQEYKTIFATVYMRQLDNNLKFLVIPRYIRCR